MLLRSRHRWLLAKGPGRHHEARWYSNSPPIDHQSVSCNDTRQHSTNLELRVQHRLEKAGFVIQNEFVHLFGFTLFTAEDKGQVSESGVVCREARHLDPFAGTGKV